MSFCPHPHPQKQQQTKTLNKGKKMDFIKLKEIKENVPTNYKHV